MTPAVGQQRDVYEAPLQKPAKPRVHANPRSAAADEFEDDAVLKGVLFDGIVLTGLAFDIVEMEQAQLANVRMNETDLDLCVFADLVCENCDFANLRARDTSVLKSTIATSRLTGSHWTSGQFTDVTIEGTRADLAQFRQSKLRRVVFRETNLTQADFQFAELTHVSFENCDLSGAQFANAKMTRVEFTNCTMLHIGGTAGLKGATVRGSGALELALSLARDAGIEIEQ
ncbi:pentapeptide repeat-containing protein [Streptomyces scabiei]|uniref:pentapeptide repeat-containing protein n=1 Tax=Streptomyces scabiei TaxID=1930 RepID=UPI0033D5166C